MLENNMKKIFLLIIILSFVFCQFDWEDNGVPVRQGVHIEWQRTGDNGNINEMIYAWSDTRSGGRDIFVQKINSNGDLLWGSEGSPVVVADGTTVSTTLPPRSTVAESHI